MLHLRLVAGTSENHNRQTVPFPSLAQPRQDLEPGHLWHLQIQQEKLWDRKLRAVSVKPLAAEILNCFLPVADYEDRVLEPGFL